MISAMTIAELGTKMRCGKCSNKDLLCKATRQEDTSGFVKGY